MGVIYLRNGELAKAEKEFLLELKNFPRNFEAHYLLALLYVQIGKNRKAFHHLKSAFACDQNIKKRAKAETLFTVLRENPEFSDFFK